MEVEYKEGTLGSKSVLKSVRIFSLSPSYVPVVKLVKPKYVLSVVTNQFSVVNLLLDPARAFMKALKALKARSTHSRTWGPKVKWVSSLTPRILGVLFHGVTSSPIRNYYCWWSQDWGVSEVNGYCISGGQTSCLPSAHLTKVVQSKFTIASAFTMLEGE